MDVGEFCDNVVFYSGAVLIYRNKNSGQYMCITNSCATKRGCYVITDMLPEFHQCK